MLSRKSAQFAVSDIDLHHISRKAVPAQPGSHALRQHIYDHLHILFRRQVSRRSSAVPDALHRDFTAVGCHRGPVLSSGKSREDQSDLPENALQKERICPGKISDRQDPVPVKLALCRSSYEEKVRYRALPDNMPVVIPVDHCNGVRLSVVRSELGKDLVPADAYAHRDPEFMPDPVRDPRCQFRAAPEAFPAPRAVYPALVEAVGFHKIRILPVDFPCLFRKAHIQVHSGGKNDQPGACLSRLPQCLPGLHSGSLRCVIGCQDDPVSLFRISSDCQRPACQFRMVEHLHTGVEAVAV